MIAGSTGNNLISVVQGAVASITNGAKVIGEGANTSGVLIGGLFSGPLPLSSVTVDGLHSTLDAGSALVVGTHQGFISVFGAGVAAAGELIVRNEGIA